MLKQSLILLIVGRDVCLKQHRLFQGALYLRIAKGVFFKLFAGNTPVSIEIEHHRFTFCLSQGAIELIDIVNAGEVQMRLRLTHRRAKCPVLQRTHADQCSCQQQDLHKAHPWLFRPQADDKCPGEECDAKHRPQTHSPLVSDDALQQEHR